MLEVRENEKALRK